MVPTAYNKIGWYISADTSDILEFLHTFKNILKVNKPVYLTALKNITSYEQK